MHSCVGTALLTALLVVPPPFLGCPWFAYAGSACRISSSTAASLEPLNNKKKAEYWRQVQNRADSSAYIRSINMGQRAHLEQSPCRRALLTARSFSRGLVPGSEHSFVNFRASGVIEVPLESSAASAIDPVPAHVRLSPWWCPGVLQRHFKIGPLEPCTLFEIGSLLNIGSPDMPSTQTKIMVKSDL